MSVHGLGPEARQTVARVHPPAHEPDWHAEHAGAEDIPPPDAYAFDPEPDWRESMPGQESAATSDKRDTTDLQRYGIVDWRELWSGESKPVEYLIPEILPAASAAAFYSGAGVGKSLLFLDWSMRLSLGRSILGEPTERRHVLYIDMEQDRTILRERLESLGYGPDTDMSHFHYSLLGDWPPLDTPEGGTAMVAVARHFAAALAVVDTISRTVRGKENEADTYLALYRDTVLPLRRLGVAFVRLDHAGKDPERGQRGSSAKESDVDTIYRLDVATDTRLILRREKNRLHLPGPDLLGIDRGGEPLAHTRANIDTQRETHIADLVAALEALGLPVSVGRPTAAKSLRDKGIKFRNEYLSAALHRRRLAAAGGSAVPEPPSKEGGFGGTVHPEPPRDSQGQPGDTVGTARDSHRDTPKDLRNPRTGTTVPDPGQQESLIITGPEGAAE